MTTETPTPEERADAAARDLSDRGQRVTARAVRELAGVQMSVANRAAKAWNEALDADSLSIPEAPSDVRARVESIWADAYRAAYYLVTPERDRLAAELSALRDEHSGLLEEFSDLEDENTAALDGKTAAEATAEEWKAKTAEAQRENEALTKENSLLRERIDSEKADRERLEERLSALIARIPENEQR